MNNKRRKAAFLLDEIGNVSDVYLQEALSYKKERFYARPWVAAVACILAVVLVGGGLLNSPLMDNILGAFDKAENPEVEAPATLDSFLSANRGTLTCTAVSENELDYFGSTYLVLQYEGDETLYRSRDLTSREVDKMLDLMGQGASVGEASPTLLCRVWLVCEDGTVLSPYLKNTDGNRGHAVLFDYEAEILPSSSLISCISDILN
ncbi:MAG: hypothetical protein J6Q70_01025 [Clostridia bacterium]|nr:hypothetical protein [Clostridia bacterium]